MSLFSRIASYIRNPARARRRLHLKQRITVTLPAGMSAEHFWLVSPLPAATEHQEVDGAPVFNIDPTEVRIDPIYGNRYAAWRLSGAPGSTNTIEGTFTVDLQPTRLTLSDYTDTVFDENVAPLYRQSNAYLCPNDARIQEVADTIVRHEPTVAERVRSCNEYVKKRLTYGAPIQGLYSAVQALELPAVDCGGYGTLLVSLLIACGIPARIVSGFWIDGKKNAMHAWVEAEVSPGVWLPLDPSVEELRAAGRTNKIGGVGETGSDRLRMSAGCDLSLVVGNTTCTTDILQCPAVYPSKSGIIIEHHITTA